MKHIYIATLKPKDFVDPIIPEGMPQGLIPEQKFEKVVIAENITEVEGIIHDKFTMDRIVVIDQWLLAEGNETREGDFYMADTAFLNEAKDEEDSAQFFIRAETFQEIENIIAGECGETFRYIKAIEKSPYEVLGF